MGNSQQGFGFLLKSGGVMSGNLNLGHNSLILNDGATGGLIKGSNAEANVLLMRNIADSTVCALRMSWLAATGHITLAGGYNVDGFNMKDIYKTFCEQVANEQTTDQHTGDTSETVQFTHTVLGGTLGLTGGLFVKAGGYGVGNNGTKTIRVKFGAGDLATLIVPADASVVTWNIQLMMFNKDAANDQRAYGLGANGKDEKGEVMYGNSNVDTANDQDLTITVQLANAGDQNELHSVSVQQLKT